MSISTAAGTSRRGLARNAGVAAVGALLLFSFVATTLMLANASTATTTGTVGTVTLYLNNSGTTELGCGTPTPSYVGSLENSPGSTTNIGTASAFPAYCTSASGAYSGPTLTITQVSVTLVVESNSVTDVLNNTVLDSEQSGTGTVLASAGYNTTPSWSTPDGCTSQTYSLAVAPSATLMSGDVAISFAFVESGTASLAEPVSVCTGGATTNAAPDSSVTITGTVATPTTTTITSTTTTTVTATTTTTVASTCSDSGGQSYYLDFENTGGTSINGPVNLGGKQVFRVDNFSWSDNPSRGGAGGAGAGRGPALPFDVALQSTKDTVQLLKAEALGQTFNTVHLYVIGSPGCATLSGTPFMDFKLTHASISSYKITGATGKDGGVPEDELIISAQSVTLTQDGTSVVA